MNEKVHPGMLKPEDYEEPACPFCTDFYEKEKKPVSIDLGRMTDKLDEYLGKNDYEGAKRHLDYWLAEAKNGRDLRGELAVYNEKMGLYRKCAEKEKAYEAVQHGLSLLSELALTESVTGATVYLNAATVYKAFGDPEGSLPLYREAQRLYERFLKEKDGRLGGLYNNMALALTDCGAYAEARAYYEKAIAIMGENENGALEQAISYLNLADTAGAQFGDQEAEAEITEYLMKAQELINTPSLPRNGYYAFVCEKCAPTFDYYGYFLFAGELRKRAEVLYERA